MANRIGSVLRAMALSGSTITEEFLHLLHLVTDNEVSDVYSSPISYVCTNPSPTNAQIQAIDFLNEYFKPTLYWLWSGHSYSFWMNAQIPAALTYGQAIPATLTFDLVLDDPPEENFMELYQGDPLFVTGTIFDRSDSVVAYMICEVGNNIFNGTFNTYVSVSLPNITLQREMQLGFDKVLVLDRNQQISDDYLNDIIARHNAKQEDPSKQIPFI